MRVAALTVGASIAIGRSSACGTERSSSIVPGWARPAAVPIRFT